MKHPPANGEEILADSFTPHLLVTKESGNHDFVTCCEYLLVVSHLNPLAVFPAARTLLEPDNDAFVVDVDNDTTKGSICKAKIELKIAQKGRERHLIRCR